MDEEKSSGRVWDAEPLPVACASTVLNVAALAQGKLVEVMYQGVQIIGSDEEIETGIYTVPGYWIGWQELNSRNCAVLSNKRVLHGVASNQRFGIPEESIVQIIPR